MPKVSVIIPTYNQAHFIAESIQSAIDQTFRDFEIIVVDDGSTDNTKEVVESFKCPCIRYIHQENRGVAAACNTGMRASTSEYITFLASDDLWLPRNLELKIKLLNSRPDMSIVCSDMYVFDSDTGAILRRRWQHKTERYLHELQDGTRQPLREYLLSWGTLFGPTMVARRQVFDEVGYFDESLQVEDFDMNVRILQHFSTLGIINLPLIRYRKHRDSLSANFEKTYPADLLAINKIINSYSLSKENIKLVRRKLARIHFDYGCEKIEARGEITSGREKLLASIRVNPWWARPYFYLIFSLLGNRSIQTLKSWKRQLVRRF
jgi:glycosyltransferase involved in cell wall biosynthesis